MKKHLLFVACCCFFPSFASAAETTVPVSYTAEEAAVKNAPAKKFSPDFLEISPAIAVPTPVFADVKNLQDKVFDADAKLRTFIPDFSKFSYARATAGTDGFFLAPNAVPAERDALTLFRFFVTPKAFTRSKIIATTPQKCELWINGNKVADKLSAEDDLKKSGNASANFNFDDGRAEIVVKVLSQKDSALAPAVKIELEALSEDVPAPVFSSGTEKRPVTIADVNETETVSELRVSPDGKFVFIARSRLRDDGSRGRCVEVRETATGKQVFFEDTTRSYAWMPQGARLYYRRSDTNNRCAFVGYDFEKQEEAVFAENLPNTDYGYNWTPDESALIVTKKEKWKNESPDWKRVVNMSDRENGWRDRSFLLRYDLKTGIFETLTAGSQTTRFGGISPDSASLVFSTEKIDYAQPDFSLVDLYLQNLKTLKCEPLFENLKFGVSVASWSPDSKKLLLIAGQRAFDGLGSTLPQGTTGNIYDTQAFIYDLETKQLEPISREFDPTISSGTWAGDGKIYMTTVDRDMRNVYRYDPATKKYEKIAVPEDYVSAFSVQRDVASFVPEAYAVASGAVDFASVYKVDLKKNAVTRVFAESAPVPAAEKLAMPEVKPWAFTASDGTEIDGYYFLPPNFDPTKKYPLIVYYYSGTTPTSRLIGAHYPFPLYTAHGYVVYVVQPSGTIGYGQEFSARHVNAWGKRTADDIIEGVKKFCLDHTFVDAKKIGCIGASYGGFMTMYLQTRTDIFAAAVAHAGISDITSYWGEGTWGYAYNAIAAAGSFPWKNREIFIDQSPLFSADKVNTPILLCHGVADVNVPVGESIQMFTALKLLGKPVEFLTFTAEDHGIMNYARRKQWIKSHLAWFARWLKNEPDWWNTLYPDKNW